MPNIWTLIAELLMLLAKYAPQAATILATAWGFIKAHDWAGLAAYLESLILHPPIPLSPGDVDKLKTLAAGFKSHASVGTVLP